MSDATTCNLGMVGGQHGARLHADDDCRAAAPSHGERDGGLEVSIRLGHGTGCGNPHEERGDTEAAGPGEHGSIVTVCDVESMRRSQLELIFPGQKWFLRMMEVHGKAVTSCWETGEAYPSRAKARSW